MPTLPYLATIFVDTSNNDAGTYAAAGNVIKLTPPKMKRGKSKTSNLSSANRAHTYLPGWIDGDVVKFVIEFTKTDFNTLFGYFTTDVATRKWKIRYNDGTTGTSGSTVICSAIITEMGDEPFDRETEDEIQTELTLCLSGLPVFAQAT